MKIYLPDGTLGASKLRRFDLDGSNPEIVVDNLAQSYGVALDQSRQLPVELVSFTARVDNGTVRLLWETASESNNAGFKIQHYTVSTTQESNEWETIAFVDGAGTTTEAQLYTYPIPDLQPGTHRFHMEQIDFDGTSDVSREVEVVIELPDTHQLSEAYANPFGEGVGRAQATFTLTVAREQQVGIEVFDASGRHMTTLHQGTLVSNVAHAFRLDADQWPSGLYFYRVTGEAFQDSKPVMLVK